MLCSYANMDFLVLFTLINVLVLKLTLSYDIVCQWSRNLKKRIIQFPSWMRIPPAIFASIVYVIPKFHIHGHGSKCQFRFSFNFLRWSARTNGEDIERWWAHVNPISMSTKEMSSGARHNVIDDHAAFWNFRKITGFGKWFSGVLSISSLSNLASEQVPAFSLSFRRPSHYGPSTSRFLEGFRGLFRQRLLRSGQR
jgi:hypothetical protein